MKRVFVASMGCRLNQYDGAALSRLFEGDGWSATSSAGSADLVVLNSCTVTDAADREAGKLLRRLRAEAPGATLAVTGCLAQRDPEGVAAHPEVDLVLGTAEKRLAAEIVRAFEEGTSLGKIHVGELDQPGEVFLLPVDGQAGRTRAFLKVQEGCDRACSYCIIPRTRGRERSVPVEKVVAEVRRLADIGVPEVVLTGVHIGGYGRDLDLPTNLLGLLRALEEAPEPIRLRISSMEPMELDEELVDFVAASGKIVPHLHLPLQAGSNRVLSDMNRGYTAERYLELAERAAARIARVQLGSDVIVGFPTEGDEEFEETFRLVERSPLSYLHVFPYSPRSGTAAASLPPLRTERVRERSARLRALGAAKRAAFGASFAGSVLPVLAMTRRPDGSIEGQSDNYLPVVIPPEVAASVPLGRYSVLRLERFDGAALVAAPTREEETVAA